MTSGERSKRELAQVFHQFETRCDFVSGNLLVAGHINDTYRVSASQGGHRVLFTLQRVNTRIFKDIPGLMDNITRISRHAMARLRQSGTADASRRALQVVSALDGKPYHQDPSGNFWRMYIFIDGVRTHDRIGKLEQAFEAARAFARFQGLLADLPGGRLNETIVGFHHTRSRYEILQRALAEDKAGRAACVRREIDFALARADVCGRLLDLMASGDVPERVTHNDTKINNVLMDEKTGEGLCIIDLDTCMPGCALYDFGDMVRSATNSAAEDDPATSQVHCRRDVFEALARGYLSAGGFLTSAERANLVTGGILMALECGIRFLTDHLQGDIYFKVHREGQNLDRCRTQFALVKSIEEQADALRALVASL